MYNYRKSNTTTYTRAERRKYITTARAWTERAQGSAEARGTTMEDIKQYAKYTMMEDYRYNNY